MHSVGDIVKYRGKPYVVINEDFECGGIHVLGIVRLEKYKPIILMVKYVGEETITDYDQESLGEIKRGM